MDGDEGKAPIILGLELHKLLLFEQEMSGLWISLK